jgi:nodulation protein A
LTPPGDLCWAATWEDDVSDLEHDALGALLARCFPRSRAPFGPGRSWASARPELRLVASAGDRPVAHLAVLRRFLQIGGVAQLVGDVGLVAIDPELQGSGVGAELLARCRTTLHVLDLPFGYLTTGPRVAGFYETGGWVVIPGPTRQLLADGRVQVHPDVSMVLPVYRQIEEWPAGRVDRNGWEV